MFCLLVVEHQPDNASNVSKFHSPAAQAIGDRIRDARLAQGITMDDLAELSEMSLTSIGKIERGAQSPTAETLVRIATALNIDAGSLITGISPNDFGRPTHGYTARDFLRERRRHDSGEDSDASSA